MNILKRTKILFLLSVLLLSSCNKSNSIFHYEITNEEGIVVGYNERKIIIDGNERIDSIYKFDRNKLLEKKLVEMYQISEYGLQKGNETYLSLEKDSCWVFGDIAYDTKTCYLGKEDLIVNGVEYRGLYKFKSQQLEIDGLTTEEHYDKDFILAQKEVINGPVYFKISRIESNLDNTSN